MQFSKFTQRFTEGAGIVQLMEDLGNAMAGGRDVTMLGGGNPAHIPEVQAFFIDRFQRIAENPAELAHIVGNYDPPKGEQQFIKIITEFINEHYGWGISQENVVLTAGSQSAFFMLFNMLGGEFDNGVKKQILLPMAPEYIGYKDVGLVDDLFTSSRPTIETLDEHTFKYHVDFNAVKIHEGIGAICTSRPTNPTGNVLSDEEMDHLVDIAQNNDIPLIIDNAYGAPFPNIMFTEANLLWNTQTILCMSLSKLGLPGVRTGIVIAPKEIASAIAQINGVLNLALSSFGPALTSDLISSGEVTRLSNNIIRPFYEKKSLRAIELCQAEFKGLDYYIHKAEGALFLWLWLPELSITSQELYERLKDRGVIIVPGHHFFPGLKEEWEHKHQCIRINHAMPDHVVSKGISIIAEELRAASK